MILFVVVFVIGILSFWVYVKQLSIEDRWLLFTKKVASQYAKELLAAQPFPKIPSTTQPFPKVPDELIDLHIWAENGVVMFDSNDQDHFFAIAYSPNREPDPLQSNKPKRVYTWRKLQKDWYALNIDK